MIDDNESKNFSCSFCKRKKNEVQKLIAGKNSKGMITFICDVCTEICYIALKNNNKTESKNTLNLLNPQQIYDKLCENVHGQEDAKKVLSVAAYNHYKRILYKEECNNIEKSNILMIGKSGSGKTLLVENLSKILNVPFVSIDVTTLTEAGYVGDDVEICISRLLQASNNNISKAEHGIVFLDEIDKLRKKNNSIDGAIDVSGVGVQYSLLKLIEGTIINVPTSSKKSYNHETVNIDTKNILFICAGAFEDLTKIVEKDIKSSIGLHNDILNGEQYDNIMKNLNNQHLIKYGIIPELLGRMQINVVLKELTSDDLVQILTKPKNAILSQYRNLLKVKDNAKLSWTDEALIIIAEKAIKNKAGARGLKSIIEKILLKVMFDIPSITNDSVEIIINKDSAEGISEPIIKTVKKKKVNNKSI